jgi:3',5'-cyclic AMP phosphodiesterase CpdA
MTDIHVSEAVRAPEGLRMAVDHAASLAPDFVVTGGDLIFDALEVPYEEAVEQYELYKGIMGSFRVPVYNALGNHEVFGWFETSGASPDHPKYGKTLFKDMLGRDSTYYSFDHGGWHFVVLDAMTATDDRKYIGHVDSVQMEWIAEDLAGLDTGTPVAVITHFPFVSVAMQLREGGTAPLPDLAVIGNSNEVFELFAEYNLRLVLQGHLHIVE